MDVNRHKRIVSSLIIGVLLLAGLLLWLNGAPPTVWADSPTRFVATDGDDGYNCSSIAQRCRTVQRAIDIADAFDEIWVATGTYTDPAGTVAEIGKTVTLLGGWNDGFTVRNPGIYPTVLDAERNGRVVYISGAISPTIDGFTITGGDATSATHYAGYGGGIYSRDASPIITNNVITDNVANAGISGQGRGGGFHLYNSSTSAIVRGNHILSNAAAISTIGHGGGLYLDHSAVRVSDNVVQGNLASTADQGSGGGLYLTTSPALVRGNTISNNVACTVGTGEGGGLILYNSQATLDGNRIISNTAPNGGGGLSVNTSIPFTLTNNVIAQNRADDTMESGGIKVWGWSDSPASGILVNNTIAQNNLGGDGKGIYATNITTLTLVNNIIVSHTYGIYAIGDAIVSATHTLFYGNTNGDTGGSGTITNTDLLPKAPSFVNPAEWDYDIEINSPAVDSGIAVPWLQTDIRGHPRHFGPAPDLGAYEVTVAFLIHKTGPAAADPGQAITYTLSVTNSGTFTASAVVITDVLPTEAHYVSGGTLMPGDVVSWTVPSLPGGGASSQVQFVVTTTETITNSTYGVSCAEGVSAQSTKNVVTFIGDPELAIGKVGPATAVSGEPITYTLTITNSGPAPATGLVITDVLPAGAGRVIGGALMPGGVVSWTVPSLPGSGASVQVQFIVTATETITNALYGVTCAEGVSAVGGELVVTTIVSPAFGNLFVTTGGSGTDCSQVAPCALETALGRADDGNTIYMAQGTYTGAGEAVVTVTQSITLYGGWDGAPTGPVNRDPDAHVTILDGEGERRVIYISGSITPTLDGLTITGGNATFAITDAGYGGGIFSEYASPIIQNNFIISNVAAISATAGSGGGMYGEHGTPIIQNNVIIRNVVSDTTYGRGGGIYLYDASASALISGNLVLSNTVYASSAAIYGGGGLFLSFSDVTVRDNLIQGNTTDKHGGGILVYDGNPRILDNEIQDNESGRNGGGIYSRNSDQPLIGDNWIVNNVAGWNGGGICASSGGQPTIVANRILGNTSGNGAGLLLSAGYYTVTNNLIAHNDSGGGIALSQGARYGLVAHNTIVLNTGSEGGIYLAYGYITPTVVNNIVAYNAYGIRAHTDASGTLDYNDVWGNTILEYDLPGALEPGAHSIQADPLFADVAGNDYHLRFDSPCIDAGLDVGVLTDVDGEPRPNGPDPDIGADEYYFTCATALTGAGISGRGSGYTDTLYTFTAVVTPSDATEPITYTWSPEPDAGQSGAVVSYTWTTSNTQVITLTAENCGGSDTVTHTIAIKSPPPGCPRPLANVSINGPTEGSIDTSYTFTASVAPADATPPITYTWQAVEQGQVVTSTDAANHAVSFTWASPGAKIITVTAQNCADSDVANHTIIIEGQFDVYLPTVLRSYSSP